MNKYLNGKFGPIIKLALSGLLVSFVSLFIWVSVNEGNDGFAVGEVTAVSEESLTVADRYEANTRVLIVEETTLFKKGEPVEWDSLVVGDFVQVNGEPVDEKTIKAKTILLLRPPRNKR